MSNISKYESSPERWGLVLEGGGLRGLYTAGVLDVLMKHNIYPNVICGTSAGVIVGSNMKSQQQLRMLRYSLQYAGDPRYISIYSWLKTGNIVNEQFAYHDIPFNLVPFDFQTFKNTPIEFYATVTNLQTGCAEYKQIYNAQTQMPLMQASASLPFMSKPVKWCGELYLDGGIVDNIPIDHCLSCGCNKILVILTHPISNHKNFPLSLLARLWYHNYQSLINDFDIRNQYFSHRLQQIQDLSSCNQIFVVAPKEHLKISTLEHNMKNLTMGYLQGYNDMSLQLNNLLNYLKA